MDDPDISNEVYAQQRKGLVKNLQICLKALLASSDRSRDIVFENSIHLDRFCLALEKVFRHGFKDSKKKQLFGPPRDFWSYVRELSRFLPHSKPSIDNVNNLAQIKTQTGKGRAWIRCALIEKSLESYIYSLLKNNRLTQEWYEPWAFLIHEEEAEMLIAMLAPLSTVDFSLCLKDIDFDNMPSNLGMPDEVNQSLQNSQALMMQIEQKEQEFAMIQDGKFVQLKDQLENEKNLQRLEFQSQLDSLREEMVNKDKNADVSMLESFSREIESLKNELSNERLKARDLENEKNLLEVNFNAQLKLSQSDFQAQIKTSNELLNKAQEELALIRGSQGSSLSQINQLQQSIANSNEEIALLKHKLTDSQAHYTLLNQKLSESTERNSQLQNDYNQLLITSAASQREIDQLKTELNASKSSLDDLRCEYENYKISMATKGGESEFISNLLEQQRKELEEIKLSKFEVDRTILDFKKELDEKEKTILDLNNQREKFFDEKNHLKQSFDHLSVEKNALQSQLSTLQTNYVLLQNNFEANQKTLENSLLSMKEKESLIFNLQAQLSTEKNENLNQLKVKNELELQLTSSKNLQSQLEKKVDGLQNELNIKNEECRKLKKGMDELSKNTLQDKSELQAKYDDLQTQYSFLSTLNEEKQNLQNEVKELNKSMKKIQKEANILAEKNTKCEKELESGKVRLKESEKIAKSLQNEVKDLQRKIKEKDAIISEKNEQISSLQLASVKLSNDLEKKVNFSEILKSEKSQLENSLAQFDKKHKKLILDHDQSLQQIENLKVQLENFQQVKNTLTEISTKFQKLQNSAVETQQLYASADKETHRLGLIIKEKELIIEDLNRKISLNESQIEDLRAIISAKGGELSQLHQIIKEKLDVENKMQMSDTELKKKENEVEELKNLLNIKNDLVNELKLVIQNRNNEIESMKAEIGGLKKDLDSKTNLVSSTERALDALKDKFDDIISEKKSLSQSNERLKEQIHQQQSIIEQINNQSIDASEKNEELDRVRKNLELTLKDFADQNNRNESTIADLNQQLAQKIEFSDQLQKSFDDLSNQFQSLSSDYSQTSQRLEGADKRIGDLENDFANLQSQFEQLKLDFDALSAKSQNQIAEIDRMSAENDSLAQSLSFANQSLSQSQQKVDELEKLLNSSLSEIAKQQQTNHLLSADYEKLQSRMGLVDLIRSEKANLKKISNVRSTLVEDFNKSKEELAARKRSMDSLNQQLASLKAQDERSDVSDSARQQIQSTKVVILQELKNDREFLKQAVEAFNQQQFRLKVCDEEIVKLQNNIRNLQSELSNYQNVNVDN